ncbi:MAG: ferrous iron transport protein A [Hungatella sp.]|jgi:ferrous iron transport protein A|nr:ferrous iron transport protein A [Hungatella sp.]MCI9638192.1 ferrous iron transport protein A [Hungatella sp.]
MTLRDLKPGQQGKVTSISTTGAMKRRIMDMGVTPGVEIRVVKVAPLGDPVEVNVRGYELSLRKDEAAQIQVQM